MPLRAPEEFDRAERKTLAAALAAPGEHIVVPVATLAGVPVAGVAYVHDATEHGLSTPAAEPRHNQRRTEMANPAKNTICLWYDGGAEDAARFYASTFPDSSVGAVHRAPGDFPGGKTGDALTVEFTVLGIPCLGLNGGPTYKHTEAFSFQVATADQAETDRYWDAIVGNGGEESRCGWCRDRWGVSWQITPVALTEGVADPDRAAASRAFDAMMQMRKIDIATIEAARRG